uniref:Putative secreted peptide n=1 Tax=Rhipicephalus pulchellus TaxID=72859 RepID=L7MCG3_RHIPC
MMVFVSIAVTLAVVAQSGFAQNVDKPINPGWIPTAWPRPWPRILPPTVPWLWPGPLPETPRMPTVVKWGAKEPQPTPIPHPGPLTWVLR